MNADPHGCFRVNLPRETRTSVASVNPCRTAFEQQVAEITEVDSSDLPNHTRLSSLTAFLFPALHDLAVQAPLRVLSFLAANSADSPR